MTLSAALARHKATDVAMRQNRELCAPLLSQRVRGRGGNNRRAVRSPGSAVPTKSNHGQWWPVGARIRRRSVVVPRRPDPSFGTAGLVKEPTAGQRQTEHSALVPIASRSLAQRAALGDSGGPAAKPGELSCGNPGQPGSMKHTLYLCHRPRLNARRRTPSLQSLRRCGSDRRQLSAPSDCSRVVECRQPGLRTATNSLHHRLPVS